MIKVSVEMRNGEPIWQVYKDTTVGMVLKEPIHPWQKWLVLELLPIHLFDDRSFRPERTPRKRKIVFACPKGFYDPTTKVCKGAMLTPVMVFYPRAERNAVVNAFYSGALQKEWERAKRRFETRFYKRRQGLSQQA